MDVRNERQLISEFDSSSPERLVALLNDTTPDEEQALRAFLGDSRCRQMKDLAWRSVAEPMAKRGNVVLVPGLWGSQLSAERYGEPGVSNVWPARAKPIPEGLDKLMLADDGRLPAPGLDPLRATAVMNRWYGEMVLRLSANWNVRPFAYDWRKDLSAAAVELEAYVAMQFGCEEFHIVAHSMGCLVALEMLSRRRGTYGNSPSGQLVLIGSLHSGTWNAARILAGKAEVISRWDRVANTFAKARKSRDAGIWDSAPLAPQSARRVLSTFVSLYQMLPRPKGGTGAGQGAADWVFDHSSYSRTNPDVSARHLEDARDRRGRFDAHFDPDSTVVIAGFGQPTLVGPTRGQTTFAGPDAYTVSLEGDGVISGSVASLSNGEGQHLATYYVKAAHGSLIGHPTILAQIDDLLDGKRPGRMFRQSFPRDIGPPSDRRYTRILEQARAAQEQEFSRANRRLSVWSVGTDTASRGGPSRMVSPEERNLEASLTGGFLATDESPILADVAPRDEQPRMQLGLMHASLEELYASRTAVEVDSPDRPPAIDAVSIGIYQGTLPTGVSLAVDRVVTKLLGQHRRRGLDNQGRRNGPPYFLTELARRSQLPSELGQLFIVPDPCLSIRATAGEGDGDGPSDRIVVVAGMGPVGQCGPPELNLLIREIVLTLGELGRRHLATVLIGSGEGNMGIETAIHSWIHGASQRFRLSGPAAKAVTCSLERVTLVEIDPDRVLQIDRVIQTEVLRNGDALAVDYKPLSDDERDRLGALVRAPRVPEDVGMGDQGGFAPEQTRANVAIVTVEKGSFFVSALTRNASVPRRQIALSASLVRQASEELERETDPTLQLDRGQFLGRLVLPQDLRSLLFSEMPLVMMLDQNSARIPWEMVAHWPLDLYPASVLAENASTNGAFPESNFLGISYGLTRQLWSSNASPPFRQNSEIDLLRILVVADAVAEAPLPGALSEGNEVADVFESWNRSVATRGSLRVEVTRLFGPVDATITNVLREIVSKPYDVLHYAGHAVYDKSDPAASGWIFSRGERLTASMLSRVDRVPRFIFSNGCESGVMPERIETRSPELPTTLAEQFLSKGVANVVVTGWPVDDQAAQTFARVVYSSLLGLTTRGVAGPSQRAVMYMAMKAARAAIAGTPGGVQTWGAYQHYGSPFFRLLPDTGSGGKDA